MVPLGVVASFMGEDKIVTQVQRITGPMDEVDQAAVFSPLN
jgi:hypothetical protein